MEHVQLAELPDKLDVAEHLAFGQILRLLLLFAESSGALVEGAGDSRSILKLMSTVGQKDSLEGGVFGLGRVKVRCIFREPLAQLRVHRTVLRLIEGFFEDQENDTFDNCGRLEAAVDYVAAQLFKLFRRELIEDRPDPSKNLVVVVILGQLGKFFSSVSMR